MEFVLLSSDYYKDYSSCGMNKFYIYKTQHAGQFKSSLSLIKIEMLVTNMIIPYIAAEV